MALGAENRTDEIFLGENGSSVFLADKTGQTEPFETVRAADFFVEHAINHIDVMKINIEGGEYDLLEHLVDAGLIGRIENLQIQFHDIPEIDAQQRMERIWQKLSETHRVSWKFRPFVWENWKRRK